MGCAALQQAASLPASVWPYLAAAFVAVALIGVMRSREWARVLLALIATGLLGYSWAMYRAHDALRDRLQVALEQTDIQVSGVIASLPQSHERGVRFLVDVIESKPLINARQLSITWYRDQRGETANAAPLPVVRPGERWNMTVRLRTPHGSANPHGFDFELWALERGIDATGYVRNKEATVRTAELVPEFWSYVHRSRAALRERIGKALAESPYRGVIEALVIGEQNVIRADDWQTFWRTGVGHLMSISGLHITMLASLAFAATYWLWVRVPRLALRIPARKVAVICGALAAMIYTLVAGFGVPAQRTLYMLIVVAIALWRGSITAPLTVLALAALAVCVIDPWAVTAPGFWLSFGAVASIFWVTAGRAGEEPWWRAALRVQLAITLMLAPASVMLFQEVSLISPLANAIAIPLVSWIVVPASIAGALLDWGGLLSLAHTLTEWLMHMLRFMAALPHAVWQSHAPSAVQGLLAVAGAMWLLAPGGVPLRWVGAVMWLPLLFSAVREPAAGEAWVDLLDVGQGLSVVVRTQHHAMVYDTGPAYSGDADAGSRIVVPFLRGEGVRRIDRLVVTHADEDHYGGALSILRARGSALMMSSLPEDHPARATPVPHQPCAAGDRWEWDGVTFEVLHPQADAVEAQEERNNALGCVIEVSTAGATLLLTADIEDDSEAELVEQFGNGLKADVLLVPHHGSKTSSTDAFLDAVRPELALVAAGYRNRFRHPHPDVLERYVRRGVAVARTDQGGAQRVVLPAAMTGESAQASSFREQHKRYWRHQPQTTEVVGE